MDNCLVKRFHKNRISFRSCVELITGFLNRMVEGGMDWINLAQDKEKWRPLAITLMKHQVL
jgi:hypothetical protein